MQLTCEGIVPVPSLICSYKGLLQRRRRTTRSRAIYQQCSRATGKDRSVSAAAQQNYEGRLGELLVLNSDQLREKAAGSTSALDLEFLLWLASREEAATGEEKERLGALAGQLTALREGLEPLPVEALKEESTQLTQTELPHQQGLVQLGVRWRALTKDSAAAALSLEAAQLAERQVSELGAGVRGSRASSAVELMGRKRLGEGESPPLGPADPAARILEALLAVQDERERLQLLPSAFEPPPESDALSEDPEGDEQLHTTPARLLQAIDFALSRLEQHPEGGFSPAGLLKGNIPGIEDMNSQLLSLRAEVFRIWSANS
ncbi:hypothetical protein COCOBI_12-0560 [Coccomyxa sp. Obi]|nr:hypothetical protein COCOBI_12-0560 [Coccomyxa sp. Obi]